MESGIQSVLQAAAFSTAGRVRATNQDAWSYSEEAGVFVVCDGMGGAAGGEVASQLAVEAFMEQVSRLSAGDRGAKAMAHALQAGNRRVYARAGADASLHGMGTTLVGLAVRTERRVAIVHVGDSRCYRMRAGALHRCTQDHSLVEEQLRLGLLSTEQAESAPYRHVLTRALGTKRCADPELTTIPVEAGDVYLLCTDGLTKELADAEIAAILNGSAVGSTGGGSGQLAQAAEALVQAAVAAGGRDNVTCMLVAFD